MSKLFYDRKKSIVSYCKGKNVLDLGCTQHRMVGKELDKNDWLHYQIKNNAKNVVGVDYLRDEVERLNKLGYNIVYGNVEFIHKVDIPIKEIDIVVCGELIEHLPNPGLFLDSVKKIMKENTLLIITTPNPYSVKRIRLMLDKQYERKWLNKEHKVWFSFETLKQLLKYYQFKEVIWGYYHPPFLPTNISVFKKTVKEKINYKHCNQIELSDGLFFISKL